jgi:hypothetical protein
VASRLLKPALHRILDKGRQNAYRCRRVFKKKSPLL